jgi:ComF family protein
VWFDVLTDAVFPPHCAGCGAAGTVVCHRCGQGLHPSPPGADPAWLEGFAAPFAYEGVAREVIARVKYRNERAAVPWLAERMASVARDSSHDPELVTWVPTTARRRRERGFDHAQRLARRTAWELGLPCRAMLCRVDSTAQTGRSRDERRRSAPVFAPRALVHGCRVLLVDDVMTTGATLASAARVLRSAGAAAVYGVTAARRP